MPKFHDEFFRRTTPAHDNLVVYCKEHKEELVEGFLDRIPEPKATTVYICSGKNEERPWCKADGHSVAFREAEEKRKYYQDNHYEKKCSECSYNKDKYKYNDKTAQVEAKHCKLTPVKKEIEYIIHETEQLCKNKDFIIGYIDLILETNIITTYDAEISPTWTWENCKHENNLINIIVEAKPHLKSWGGPLRQIKTYMDLTKQNTNNRPTYGLIVTHSNIPEKHRETLEAENVYLETIPDNKNPTLTDYNHQEEEENT